MAYDQAEPPAPQPRLPLDTAADAAAPAVAATGEYADLVARLNRERISAPGINGERRMVPLNPDGPEAAAAIARLTSLMDAQAAEVVGEIEAATNAVQDATARAEAAERTLREIERNDTMIAPGGLDYDAHIKHGPFALMARAHFAALAGAPAAQEDISSG